MRKKLQKVLIKINIFEFILISESNFELKIKNLNIKL